MPGKIISLMTRKAAPNPTASNGASHRERKYFCSRYNSCLDIAVQDGWAGFSCLSCEAFIPVIWSEEDRTEDELRCMALILAIFFQKSYAHLSPGRIVEHLEQESRWNQEFGGVLVF